MDSNYVYVDPEEPFEFTTDNEYWINRIIADAAKHPDEIKIILMPEQNNGCIKAIMKHKFMEIRPEQIQMPDHSEGVYV